MVYPREKR